MKSTWSPGTTATDHQAIKRAVQGVVVLKLMELASNVSARAQVRAVAAAALRDLLATLKRSTATGEAADHRQMTIDEIERFLARPHEFQRPPNPLAIPPGDPIGN